MSAPILPFTPKSHLQSPLGPQQRPPRASSESWAWVQDIHEKLLWLAEHAPDQLVHVYTAADLSVLMTTGGVFAQQQEND